MKLFQDANGDTSMIRVLAAIAFLIGAVVIGFGLKGWFGGLDGAPAIIGVGAGLAGGGSLLKMLQKKAENGKAS